MPKGLPNFGVAYEGRLTRSGQPTIAGYSWLLRHGIKTIINLRAERPGTFGILIPMVDERPPTEAQADEFLCLVNEPDNWPIHVHCHHGRGRTGTMVVAAQVALWHWDLDKALAASDRYYPWWHRLLANQHLDDGQADWLREYLDL